MQTDRHMTKLIVAFRNFAKALKMTHNMEQAVASSGYAVRNFHTTWCAFHGAVERGAMYVSALHCSVLLMRCKWCERTRLGNILICQSSTPIWGRDLFTPWHPDRLWGPASPLFGSGGGLLPR